MTKLAQAIAAQAANTITQQPIGSQLKNLPSVNNPTTAAPVHALARFVQGDIKGGAHAHAFRIDTIRTAIEQAYKGNTDALAEAAALSDGKAKKARAYHAGFAAVQSELLEGAINPAYCMKRVPYMGKLSAPENKAARDLIEQGTARSVAAFFAAFDAVISVKPAPKAKTVPAPAPAPVDALPAISNDSEADDSDTVQAIMALEQERIDMVAKVVAMVRNGTLSAEELEALDMALTEAAVDPASAYPTAEALAAH